MTFAQMSILFAIISFHGLWLLFTWLPVAFVRKETFGLLFVCTHNFEVAPTLYAKSIKSSAAAFVQQPLPVVMRDIVAAICNTVSPKR